MSVLVVVPTYNERDNLEQVATRILEELPEARILVVDDNSPDGTGDLADEMAGRQPDKVSVLHRDKKEGLGAAYVAGYQYALEQWPDTEFLIQMDADLSHDPSYLRPMVEMAKDADVVVGSRYTQGVSVVNWPLHRLLLSRLGTVYARIVTGLPITDCTAGFKCYRAEVLRAMDLGAIRSSGFSFQIETSFRAWRLGYRLKDLPIVFYERQRGKSKIHLGITIEGFFEVIRLGIERLSKPSPKPPAP